MLKLFISLSLVIVGSDSAKILGVFPVPSISHQIVFRPLMIELAKRGHEVTVITTDPAFPKGQTPQNLTEIDVHDVSYDIWNKLLLEYGNEKDQLKLFKLMGEKISKMFETQVKTSGVQELLHENRKFDLVFVESVIRPALVFPHIYKAPAIEFSSFGAILETFELIGAAAHPLIYPDPVHKRIYNLTLWEKVTELYMHYSLQSSLMENCHADTEIIRSVFGQNIPNLNDLKKNVVMLFLNVNPIWDFNRPVPPNVVYLGGLHQKPEQELPKDLKSYLDSSKNGVIYISFGTNVKPSMLPSEKLKILVEVFSNLPYDVLWKWDKDELPGRSKNIKISKWLPQSDLLRHPNIKLFITQGGLQSTDEALTGGVPLVGIPLLGDQWFNVEQYVKFGIGKQLKIEDLTAKTLMDSITTVIEDESYRQNIKKLHAIMRDQPQSPLERAVWWTEYVLRHNGAEYLRTPIADISWAEYYELNLVILLLVTLVTIAIVIILAMYIIISKIKKYLSLKVKIN